MAASEVCKKQKKTPFKNCPKSILNVVPQNCTKITFDDLIPGADYENKAVIGKISHLYPVGKRLNGFIRKMLVTDALSEEDENCEKKLAVFLFDQFAKDSESSELGGYIIISNFTVENVTHQKNDMPVQILVKKEETLVWFGRKVNKKATATSETPHEADKQKASEEEETHAVSTHHYEYTKLGDLLESVDKESYNVYGIVDKCDLKVTSGKKMHILDLLLTDQTDTGFSCSVFAAAGETYPDVYPGDIVRIHRMQVYKFRGKLKGRCPNPKFVLVFSKSNEGEKPRTVAKTFTFTPEDITRCRELFTWFKTKNDPKLICDIEKDDFVNIICQVIGVYVARTTDAVILKIWDGTKTNIFPGVHWGMKEEKLDHRLFTVARNYYVVLSVYGHHIASAAEIEPTQYIEVRDAHLYSPRDNPDDFKLCLHAGNREGRGITVLNESDERVLQLKERLDKVISDTLEFGSQTDHILSQNNSIFLNCDISVFTSTQGITNGNTSGENGVQEVSSPQEKEVPQSNEDVLVLNDPLASNEANQENTVVSVVSASVKPGQSTQEFGLGMPRNETDVMDVENRPSVASEPDPLCNLTPLQTRYFFHDPKQSASQITDRIFPSHEDRTQEEWWKVCNPVSVTEGHSNIKPKSLAEVVKHEVPFKFRVFAAVFNFKPNTTSIRKFIHLCCPNCMYITEDADPSFDSFETRDGLSYYFCPVCSSNQVDQTQWPVLEYNFLLSLSLHDGSGPPHFVEAYIWKENAVKFFKGITPEEALKDSATADSILHMLWNICPNCRPSNIGSSDYPILDCCILSYMAGGDTRYQIFDTILI